VHLQKVRPIIAVAHNQSMADMQGASSADRCNSNHGLSRARSVEIGFDGEEPEMEGQTQNPAAA
jgi:hypothetical protein